MWDHECPAWEVYIAIYFEIEVFWNTENDNTAWVMCYPAQENSLFSSQACEYESAAPSAPCPHHYSSGQNEYAQVLNGAHLFPPFHDETATPSPAISPLSIRLQSRWEQVGFNAVKGTCCNLILWPVGGCGHG